MSLWILAVLTIPAYFTSASSSKPFWGLENEALVVNCPLSEEYRHQVDWYHSVTNQKISTEKGSRVFSSRYLKFLPAQISDSGIYTCVIRSPTFNGTNYVNVTIYKRQSDCRIPDDFMYSTVNVSEKSPRISCPRSDFYNWTAPLEWFKNCKALTGPKYNVYSTYLLIENLTSDDAGDYTCKLLHNENGANYIVTATRSLYVKEIQGFPVFPVIRAPPNNETKEVELGETATLTCHACFGKGIQKDTMVQWRINGSKVENFGEVRIQEVERSNESNEMACLSVVLRITDVKETDLSLTFDCIALNRAGIRIHTTRLRRKKPTDHQSTYYLVAGCSTLLLLITFSVVMLKVFWIEVILLWRDTFRPYKTRNDGKLYDAYIIYPRNYQYWSEEASSMETFVHQIMPDILENKCGYNLCIYGRDLLPGEGQDLYIAISDMKPSRSLLNNGFINIAEFLLYAATAVESSIQKSRRHIFILTPLIVHSKEFAYEQEIALHSTLIQNDSKAILIEMEALGESDVQQTVELQDSLKHLMKVQGTIKWKEDHDAKKQPLKSKFWKHVRYQMPVPSKLPS